MRAANTQTVVLLTMAALLVIGTFAWSVYSSFPKKGNTTTETEQPKNITPQVRLLDPVRGNRNAANTIIVYGDFECLYCAQMETVLADVLAAHTDVRVVWKDFPLPIHPHAQLAAEAAACAADQGKYWEYHDRLMTSGTELNRAFMTTAATQTKLDIAAFDQCVEGNQNANRVRASFDEGVRVGVDGVPYLFVNDTPFSGAVSRETIETALNTK